MVVGERGHILISADTGQVWKQARVPTRVLLTAVHMHDVNNGWAVGHDAVILRTRDAGASWEISHHAPEEQRPLLDVWFHDEESGFAVGAYGYFLSTVDGGKSWQSRSISEDDFHLNVLIPAGTPGPEGQRLYIAGEAGALYRSDDGGQVWTRLVSPYSGSWFGALALDRDRIVLNGLRGHFYRSDDGGDHWTRIDTGVDATLTGAFPLRGGSILSTGLDGVLLTTRNNGSVVRLARLPSRQGISSALELPAGGILLLGEFGVERWRGSGSIENP